MTEFKRGSGKDLAPADEQKAVRASSFRDETRTGTPDGIDAGAYDELDYRLMATFPASDAVARY